MGRARSGVGIEKQVLTLVGQVGDAAAQGEDWRSVLADGVRRLSNATMGVVCDIKGWDGESLARPVRAVDAGLDANARGIFLKYLQDPTARDPFLERMTAGPMLAGVLVRREKVDDAIWYRNEYVQTYRRAARVDDMMLAALAPTSRGSALSMACHRAWADGAFTPRDIRAVALLQKSLQGWSSLLLRERLARPVAHVDAEEAARAINLPPRLAQVFELIGRGRSDKEIARSLGISINTVHMHVRRLYKQLRVDARAHAIRLAVQMATQSVAPPSENA